MIRKNKRKSTQPRKLEPQSCLDLLGDVETTMSQPSNIPSPTSSSIKSQQNSAQNNSRTTTFKLHEPENKFSFGHEKLLIKLKDVNKLKPIDKVTKKTCHEKDIITKIENKSKTIFQPVTNFHYTENLPYITKEPFTNYDFSPAKVQQEPLNLSSRPELSISIIKPDIPHETLRNIYAFNKINNDDRMEMDETDVDQRSESSDSVAKQGKRGAMTRDRRVEANARERKRVHTITAAYDKLQASLPLYQQPALMPSSPNNKLSKLSVIKIATAYIHALSRLAGHDDTEDNSLVSVDEALTNYQQTVLEETRIKFKRQSS